MQSQRLVTRARSDHSRSLVALLVMSAMSLASSGARADTANLNLSLTIITPPECTIAGGGTSMTVGFGQVQQGLIDGVNYQRMPINYQLNCTSLASNALKLTLSWPSITLNGQSAVQTSQANLGIAIYRDSTRLGNGASLSFPYGNAPALYAVPVKPTGMMLTNAGGFTGAMTMTLDYQ